MAYITNTAVRGSAFAPVARFFQIIGDALVRIAESNGRLRHVRALEAMSDAELAARGLKREDIVRHVFSDTFYV